MKRGDPRFVVAIGGSAGALGAYKALFGAMPAKTGLAFVIVSHIRPAANSQLIKILSRHTKMPVTQARQAMPLLPNHVYVIPPNADLLIEKQAFKVVSPRTKGNAPIDQFFMSLAEALGAQAIGVIFSGYGGDGSEGCRHIKANGGTTFAQDMSAEVDAMPVSARASGCVDFVLPPDRISEALQRLARTAVAKKKREFDPNRFLAIIGEGRTSMVVPEKRAIYAQGAAADAVFYIQKGAVRLTVVSTDGKEATLGILSPGDFFGEGCLTGQPFRLGSAAAAADCELMRINKRAMVLALRREPSLAEMFLKYVLGRNIRYEADLVDQLFSSSEKRLARTLLLLAQVRIGGEAETILYKISQETLAEMVGTTRSRVNFFMNRFKKLGFIEYNGGLKVKPSLLTMIVHD
ncbi:MAG: chemotaxis protein CheB [Vicinamibacterales bacterium]